MLPGITQAIFYIITIFIVCKIRPNHSGSEAVRVSREEKLKSLLPVWPVILLFVLMMGGLYGGFFTPVEAGAFGALTTLVLACLMRRLSKNDFNHILSDTMQSAGMVFFLMLGAFFLTRFITLSGVTTALTRTLLEWHAVNNIPRIVIIAIIMLFYLITGCFMSALACILLTLGIVFPIVTGLGYNPIWWGVIMVRLLETSMITPPFGLNLFSVSRTCNVPIGKMYKSIWPFVISDILHITLLVAIPEISLFLPRIMGLA